MSTWPSRSTAIGRDGPRWAARNTDECSIAEWTAIAPTAVRASRTPSMASCAAWLPDGAEGDLVRPGAEALGDRLAGGVEQLGGAAGLGVEPAGVGPAVVERRGQGLTSRPGAAGRRSRRRNTRASRCRCAPSVPPPDGIVTVGGQARRQANRATPRQGGRPWSSTCERRGRPATHCVGGGTAKEAPPGGRKGFRTEIGDEFGRPAVDSDAAAGGSLP